MLKKLKKFTVYTFTVLFTKLLYDLVMHFLPVIKSTHNPYFDVAIGMSLTLILFYPLYGFAHTWMEKFSGHYVKHARKIHSNSVLALSIAYVIGIVILFGCFMMLKFNINIVMDAYHSIESWFA